MVITTDDFLKRLESVSSYQDLCSLRDDAVASENLYRELFARQRDSWEIPEVDDPYIFLINVFKNHEQFRKLPDFPNSHPRCFPLINEARHAPGKCITVKDMKDFIVSWDCFTEGLLRFVDWNNVVAAGGSVAGCLAPLPERITSASTATTRVLRRKYFHDEFLPASDIDLFLYGLDEAQAQAKLLELFDAVQAASPYEIRAFRSTHAITLVSRYPFRHVQIVLRLYNSPSEVLQGFDVDACAAGYDGKEVFVCPRTVLAMVTQTNTVDMSRRSPSYEMRLAKYATRGFEVVVPGLDRDRVDPFLYEKRFDQNKGLARLLMIERLKTPEERLRYRLKGQLKNNQSEWAVQRSIRKTAGDTRNIARLEGCEGISPDITGPELSDYSTIFLPWGPNWPVEKLARLTKKKDAILNRIEILPNGHVIACRRTYKIHVCAVGTMEEVIGDPFPDDPPIPTDAPTESLQGTVRGELSWLVDNPGRQQIGSFNPITDEDWVSGVYISRETEALIVAANADDVGTMKTLLEEGKVHIEVRDFLGRTALHVAVLSHSTTACHFLLGRGTVGLLQARLADGRTALHLAAMRGDHELIRIILEARKHLADKDEEAMALEEVLDINGSDWESKLSAFHYAVLMGSVDTVKILLEYGADPKKPAVHKDRNQSLSVFDLLFLFASEGERSPAHQGIVSEIADVLFVAGASPAQVDTNSQTTWHRLSNLSKPSAIMALELFIALFAKHDSASTMGLDILDNQARTPLHIATVARNSQIVALLLKAGAIASFEQEVWDIMIERQGERFYMRPGLELAGKRMPVFAAIANGDKATLKVFLNHDNSISNASTKLPKIVDRQYGVRNHQQQYQESSLLDVLDDLKAQVDRRQSGSITLETRLGNAQKRLDQANSASANAKSSYIRFIWSVVSHQLQETVTQTAKGKSRQFLNDDELFETQITMLEECRVLVKEFGGENLIEIPKTDETSNPSKSASLPCLPIEPFAPFTELKGSNFQDFDRYRFSSTGNNSVSDTTQKSVLQLFEAVAANNIGTVLDLARKVPVNISDSCCGGTPLSIAAYFENIDALAILLRAAKDQYKAHVNHQHSIEEAEKNVAMSDTGTESGAVKDQLRRLNNLEIAAGDVPQSRPTPDMMRHRLENAAARASAQTAIMLKSSEKSVVRSSVKEYTTLFHRMVVVPNNNEPNLVQLKKHLMSCQHSVFPEDFITKPVRLRPIEIAVIRGHEGLATKLLDLFDQSVAEMKQNDCVADEDDDEFVDNTKSVEGQASCFQLRYHMYGEGSKNPDLGEMSLIRLALAVGNLPIFRLIARRAKEFIIPFNALASWKHEIDCSLGLTAEELKERQKLTDIISARNNFRGSNVAAWLPRGRSQGSWRSRVPFVPTILQFALAVKSEAIVYALLNGDLDGDMWGWLKQNEDHRGRFYVSKQALGPFGLLESAEAAKWLTSHIETHGYDLALISLKLSSPLAVDGLGRSSLFYATKEFINDVANAGCNLCSNTSSFLDEVIAKGYVSPLMAAASSLDLSRVEALIKTGCSTTIFSGTKLWSVVHFAIPNVVDGSVSEEDSAKTWETSKQIIDLLLSHTQPSDTAKLLLCPKSEHTPLMLATTRGADGSFLESLVKLYGQFATEALSDRDAQLNGLLHRAVDFYLNKELDNDFEGTSIGFLLKLDNAPRTLGPNVENSKGTTPVDSALDSVASPWLRAPNSAGSRSANLSYARYGGSKSKPNDDKTSKDLYLTSRQIVDAVGGKRSGRVAAGFEEVKEAKAMAALDCKTPVTTNDEEGYHSEPSGLPAVFPQHYSGDVWRFWPTKF